jgi:chemotaxis protein methyltransferase CheR
MTDPELPPLQQLVGLIRDATGNALPPARHGFLEDLAARRAAARGLPFDDYVRALAAHLFPDEWERLIPLVTIKESYFFRAPQQFEAIRQQVLPGLVRARAATRQLRFWSAACARGEEPATLAILLAEEPALAGWSWRIVATDLDEEALAGARTGLYGERAVSQVPPPLLERWFKRRGKLFELDPALRAHIDYQKVNLAHAPFALPFTQVDLVLMRNVLIYFRRPLQRWVVSQVGQLLAPEGFLFLGASETLWQIQEELEAVDLGPCFAYRHRKPAAEAPAPPVAQRPPQRRPAPVPSPEPPAEERRWLDPSPRDWSVARGAAASAASAASPAAIAPAAPPSPVGVRERLESAARDLAANRVEEASRTLATALAADPSEPAAHALEGFLHDLCGRTGEAVSSYRAALYLDPTLFQVRVLLADCLLRLGDRERAEHQFREVLTLLASGRERPLTLFGELPLPDRDRAGRRCRQVLKGG